MVVLLRVMGAADVQGASAPIVPFPTETKTVLLGELIRRPTLPK